MRSSLIAAALVGAVAASPAWSPPAYGGVSTVVVTVTSCAAEVTNCPAATTPAAVSSTPAEATTPAESTPAESPYSPVESSAPVYGSPSSPASSPYSPVESSAPVESAPATYPASSAPVETIPAPVATSSAGATPYSPIGGEQPPTYPIPGGNGTYAPTGTASGVPSASSAYPIEQTGNAAVGLKAGSFLAGCGALAALLL